MLFLGILIGFVLCMIVWFLISSRRGKKKVSLNTFTKLIVSLTVLHGMILTTLSYILAFYDKETVCTVSEVIVREIVAPVLVYLATNMIMNIFEKNKLAFSVPINTTYIGKDGKEHSYSGITNSIDENAVG